MADHFEFRKGGHTASDPLPTETITMNYTPIRATGQVVPTEDFKMNFEEIKFDYSKSGDGSVDDVFGF